MFEYSFEVLEEFWDSIAVVWDDIWKSNDEVSRFKAIEEKMILSLIKDRNSRIID